MPSVRTFLAASQSFASIDTGTAGGGQSAVGVNVAGTFSATLVFEATTDGAHWFQVIARALSSGIVAAVARSFTGPGQWMVPVLGYQQVRVRVTSYVSGAADVSLQANTPGMEPALGAALLEGQKAAYIVSLVGQPVVANATDTVVLGGSDTVVVRVTRVMVTLTTATAASFQDICLALRRGGTESGSGGFAFGMPMDPNDPAFASASVTTFPTSNPTSLGTLVGIVGVQRYFAAASGSPTRLSGPAVFEFGNRPSKCPVLRSSSELLAVNLNGGNANSATADITFEWTEE